MTQRLRVTAIEYTLVPRDMAQQLGLSPGEMKELLGDQMELAVVKCVDPRGKKLTAVGDPVDLRLQLSAGTERRRDELELDQPKWPILLQGWPQIA
ncbi:MAG TPA: hypothetical protein VE991_14970 [Acidimicrobiales bacterium]|nr:hypothetical protein [Acidimicrobiales bacterium]